MGQEQNVFEEMAAIPLKKEYSEEIVEEMTVEYDQLEHPLLVLKTESEIVMQTGEESHICCICDKAFTLSYNLGLHLLEVHAEWDPDNICNIWEEEFSSNSVLDFGKHLLEVYGESESDNKCSEEEFSSNSDLECHVTSIPYAGDEEKSQHKCSICQNKTFSQIKHLETHMINLHGALKSHKCSFCEQAFTLYSILKSHVTEIHSEKEPSSRVCEKTVPRKDQWKEHMNIQSGLKPHTRSTSKKTTSDMSTLKLQVTSLHCTDEEIKNNYCSICKKTFSHKSALMLHMTSLHEKIRYNCSICKKTFSCESNFKRHMTSLHSTKNQVCVVLESTDDNIENKCSICKKTFSKKCNLTRHITTVHDKIRQNCSICKKTFSDQSGLRLHIMSFHDKTKNNCNICKKPFSQKANFKRHMTSLHSTDEEIEHKCRICEKTFSNKFNFKRHMNSVHSGDEEIKHKRSTCKNTISDKSNFNSQMMTSMHSAGDKIDLKRSVCNKIYSHIHSLKTHVNSLKDHRNSEKELSSKSNLNFDVTSVHSEDDKIKPQFRICHKTFSQKGHLKEHINNIHNRLKPHKCSICHKTFAHIGYLKMHMNIHNGLKPNKCRICQKSYRFYSSLKYHMTSKHSGGDENAINHKCSICYKTFSHSRYLEIHMNIHSVLKPHKCSICEKSFTLKNSLQHHLTSVHSTSDKDEAMCSSEKITAHIYHEELKMDKQHTVSRLVPSRKCRSVFKNLSVHSTRGENTQRKSEKTISNTHQELNMDRQNTKSGLKSSECSSTFKNSLHNRLTSVLSTPNDKTKNESEKTRIHQFKTDNQKHNNQLVLEHASPYCSSIPQKELRVIIQRTPDEKFQRKCTNQELKVHTQSGIKPAPNCSSICQKKHSEIEYLNRKIHKIGESSMPTQSGFEPAPKCSSIRQKTKLSKIGYNNLNKRIHKTGGSSWIHKCSICKKSFPSKTALKKHITSMHSSVRGDDKSSKKKCEKIQKIGASMLHNCSFCQKSFPFKTALKQHMTSMHYSSGSDPMSPNNRKKCTICQKTYSKMYIKQHMNLHYGLKQFKCMFCQEAFTFYSTLKYHMDSKHSGEEEANSNQNKTFRFQNSLKRHLTSKHSFEEEPKSNQKTNSLNLRVTSKHSTSSQQKITCNICDKTFKHRGNLQMHILHIHSGLKQHKYGICNNTFRFQTSLKSHVTSKHSFEEEAKSNQKTNSLKSSVTSEQSFEAEAKSNQVKTKSLKSYKQFSKQKNFKCNICKKTYSSRVNLNMHILHIHDEWKPHQCRICKKSFSQKGNLEQHMNLHKGLKPHKCKMCSRSFSLISTLANHIKFVHTQERPHQCITCGAEFSRKGGLNAHIAYSHNKNKKGH